ncbi:MAG: hypothetical protein E6682_15350 [Clostridium perfringens]|uniref:hypothetical protein n=1 Tax=Clostridium perfringens TaxID=1502 RepID=UPI0018AAE63F|nr:hypothetical protein [Clostridium perfringens]UVX36141.1 MAG: hypothetical protein [Bacteriophage sp.]EGT3604703.1 hypothetical protein [Clostridium perfringens]EHR1329636.1 hypothetical protein [Clostridium perfringens]EHR1332762.1 hypothetical protein [Clostridium perfringens]EHR1426312.1 hypothetical protein [Clostridium perfringens]
MDKYIYDNSELIKVSVFDNISFKNINDTLIIEALKLGNEKDTEGKFMLEETEVDLKYDLREFVSDKAIEELVKELENEFVDFMDSDKRVFRIFEVLDFLTAPEEFIEIEN